MVGAPGGKTNAEEGADGQMTEAVQRCIKREKACDREKREKACDRQKGEKACDRQKREKAYDREEREEACEREKREMAYDAEEREKMCPELKLACLGIVSPLKTKKGLAEGYKRMVQIEMKEYRPLKETLIENVLILMMEFEKDCKI